MTVASNTAGGREKGNKIFSSQGSRHSLGFVRQLPKERANKDTTSAVGSNDRTEARFQWIARALLNWPTT